MLFSELMVVFPLTILADISWTENRNWKVVFKVSVWPSTQKTGKTQYPTHNDNDQLQRLELCVTTSAHKENESSRTSVRTPWVLTHENRSCASSKVTAQISRIISLFPLILVDPNWQIPSAIWMYWVSFFLCLLYYNMLLNRLQHPTTQKTHLSITPDAECNVKKMRLLFQRKLKKKQCGPCHFY